MSCLEARVALHHTAWWHNRVLISRQHHLRYGGSAEITRGAMHFDGGNAVEISKPDRWRKYGGGGIIL